MQIFLQRTTRTASIGTPQQSERPGLILGYACHSQIGWLIQQYEGMLEKANFIISFLIVLLSPA
jgi:hypothetical protein